MKEKFILFDKDGNGAINKTELEAVMKYMGQTPTKKEIQQMLTDLDADGTGLLEFPEYLKLVQSIKCADHLSFFVSSEINDEQEQLIKEKFLLFDEDGNGSDVA